MHHVLHFPDDPCTQMLKNNFLWTILCKTGNSPKELHRLDKVAVNRLRKRGFDLRSCNSNCEHLKNQMEKDNRIVQHSSCLGKDLGNKYYPKTDTLQISNVEGDQNVKIKESVLSQTTRVFNPLSLCIHVTVKTKILLRELWFRKLSWEPVIPSHLQEPWTPLVEDMANLRDLNKSYRSRQLSKHFAIIKMP